MHEQQYFTNNIMTHKVKEDVITTCASRIIRIAKGTKVRIVDTSVKRGRRVIVVDENYETACALQMSQLTPLQVSQSQETLEVWARRHRDEMKAQWTKMYGDQSKPRYTDNRLAIEPLMQVKIKDLDVTRLNGMTGIVVSR